MNYYLGGYLDVYPLIKSISLVYEAVRTIMDDPFSLFHCSGFYYIKFAKKPKKILDCNFDF